MFGEAENRTVGFQLLGNYHTPLQPKVSAKQFEQLLQMTHDKLSHDLGQNKIEQRLIPYSGPQCHEDRDQEARMEYTDLIRKQPSIKKEAVSKDSNRKSNRPPVPPTVSEPQPTNAAPDASQPATTDPAQETDKAKRKFAEDKWSFRVCKSCKKTRVLDERATKKFPLGSYEYCGKKIVVDYMQ